MRLRLICLLAICLASLASSEAMEQLLETTAVGDYRQSSFLEWLASIFLPIATTTAPPAATTSSSTSTTPAGILIERECESCRCGLINSLYKIVGGQETRLRQYPWMAVVLLNSRFYCGGSLINDIYVLTAAHCVEGVPAELIKVRLLEHNRSHSDALVVERQARHVRTHELYNPRSFDNDIALILLDRPVEVGGPLRPVCMPVAGYSFDGELAIVTGWGAQREGGFATDSLQEVDVLVLTQSECRNSSYGSSQISDNMLCAGDLRNGGKDSCQGDSGGPLHVLFDEQPGQYQLAGIVSWGNGCARPNMPGVYTRVNRYLRWIGTHTPGACVCMPYPAEDY